MEKNSFSDVEIYDLKYSLANFLLPRLEAYIELINSDNVPSLPANLGVNFEESRSKWLDILNRIKVPFEYLLYPERYEKLPVNEIDRQRIEGLALFSEYFESLWI